MEQYWQIRKGVPMSYIRISVTNALGKWAGVIEPENPCPATILEQTANEIFGNLNKTKVLAMKNFDGEKVIFGEDILKSSVICYRVMD